ncbi:MAG: type II secretion system F family protein, partial [Candidatus Woesearchaeota archaeon]
NLRAGMTAYQAIKLSAIPEFGVLGEEFKLATSKSTGVRNFTDYLEDISLRVNSLTLQRTIRLLVSSMKSGGELAPLLEDLSVDIAERASLKKELETNIKTNMMFIMFIIIVGTPSLLSISIYFVDTVTDIQGQTTTQGEIDGFGGGDIVITSSFLEGISYVILFMTSLLASFFLGGVLDGNIKRGLRFAPYMIIGSMVLFVIARYIVNTML